MFSSFLFEEHRYFSDKGSVEEVLDVARAELARHFPDGNLSALVDDDLVGVAWRTGEIIEERWTREGRYDGGLPCLLDVTYSATINALRDRPRDELEAFITQSEAEG